MRPPSAPRGFRRIAIATLVFCIITLLAGSQLSRLLAPQWTPVRHVIVNCGGQLLALTGLFALALEVDKMRHKTVADSDPRDSNETTPPSA